MPVFSWHGISALAKHSCVDPELGPLIPYMIDLSSGSIQNVALEGDKVKIRDVILEPAETLYTNRFLLAHSDMK